MLDEVAMVIYKFDDGEVTQEQAEVLILQIVKGYRIIVVEEDGK